MQANQGSFGLKARPVSERFLTKTARSMTLIDPATGEIVDANHAAASYYGYPQERLVGMNLRPDRH